MEKLLSVLLVEDDPAECEDFERVIDSVDDIRLIGKTNNEKEALEGVDIALDGVAVIVNPANPINDISIEQVKGIFTGEVNRWAGLG